ncbi:hypothetical protein JCM10207_001765 [Rhodosporidiobolus poonsookiae]
MSSIASTSAAPPLDDHRAGLIRSALAKVDELWDAEQEIISSRSVRRSGRKEGEAARAKSCTACRSIKIRCVAPTPSSPCSNCVEHGHRCVYPELRNRGPKRRLSKTQLLLVSVRNDLREALSGDDREPLDEEEEDEGSRVALGLSDDNLASELQTPLAALTKDGSTPEHPHAVPQTVLHGPRAEFDNNLNDPVLLGIMALNEFERLVKHYFLHLHTFNKLLLPELHTPTWLRANSPLLASAIAFTSATFDPDSAHFCAVLEKHTFSLAFRVLQDGLRSIEIIQAFHILAHWASPRPTSGDGQAFMWLMEAVRLCAELRMDLDVDGPLLDYYTTGGPARPSGALLLENRRRTAHLIFVSRLGTTILTGCYESLGPSPLPKAANIPETLNASHRDYDYIAHLHLCTIVCRALSLALRLSGDKTDISHRASFTAQWKSELEEWRQTWTHVVPFVNYGAHFHEIMLSLTSLQFKGGPPEPILAHCRSLAEGLVIRFTAAESNDERLAYSSNPLQSHIAFATVVFLQLSRQRDPQLDTTGRERCLKVADILDAIGRDRPNAPSYATLYAKRIRSLCFVSPLPTTGATVLPPRPSLLSPNVLAPPVFPPYSLHTPLCPPMPNLLPLPYAPSVIEPDNPLQDDPLQDDPLIQGPGAAAPPWDLNSLNDPLLDWIQSLSGDNEGAGLGNFPA